MWGKRSNVKDTRVTLTHPKQKRTHLCNKHAQTCISSRGTKTRLPSLQICPSHASYLWHLSHTELPPCQSMLSNPSKRQNKLIIKYKQHTINTIIVQKCGGKGQMSKIQGYLISEGVATNHNWFRPRSDQTRNIRANNRFSKHSSTKNISNRSVWRLPHLFKIKFWNIRLFI